MSIEITEIVSCDNIIKCTFCENQSVKIFTLNSGGEIYSCGGLLCDLQYLYRHNSGLLSLISLAEDYLKITPARVLIAYMTHPDFNINGRTKAGFLIPEKDNETYLWTEIFSGEPLEELGNKLAFFNEVLKINRQILVTNEELPYDRISSSVISRLENHPIHI